MLLRKAILNAFYYSGVQTMLAPVCGGLGSILMLHHVRDVALELFSPNYHLSVSPTFLDEMISQLKNDYDFISMDEVAERISQGQRKAGQRPFLSITLDDGYKDNLEHAVPIFRKHETPYTIYIAPEMVNGRSTIWWEDLENVVASTNEVKLHLPKGPRSYSANTVAEKQKTYKELMEYLFLEVDEFQQRNIVDSTSAAHDINNQQHLIEQVATWKQLKEAVKDPLCTIGAHSMCHYVLAKLDEDTLFMEIDESKRVLEEKLGCTIDHLAYPYGFVQAAATREFEAAMKCGFKTAVTTRHGVIYEKHREHMTALPRVSVNGHHQSMHYMKTLLSGLPTRLKNKGSALDVA